MRFPCSRNSLPIIDIKDKRKVLLKDGTSFDFNDLEGQTDLRADLTQEVMRHRSFLIQAVNTELLHNSGNIYKLMKAFFFLDY